MSENMIPAHLIRQADLLLEAVPDSENPILEVHFNDGLNRIEVWNMLADREKVVAMVEYDDGPF